MAVITISRQFGAGGKSLGMKLAKELSYRFADEDVVQQIASLARVSAGWVESFEKEAGGRLSRILDKMVSKPLVERVLKDERGYIDEEIYIDYLVVIIAQIADEGNVVILDRGSQYILRDMPDTFHILLTNSFENRVRFIMKQYEMSEQRATQYVKSEDRRRTALYRKLGKHDYDHPDLYHMVINTARVDMNQAVGLIRQLASLDPAASAAV